MSKQKGSKLPTHMQFQAVSPATKLLEKRRRMYQVHQAFQAQKQEFKKQQNQFKRIEEDIRKKDLQIQIQLINFCQFIQDNQSKRKKAQDRLRQEQKACKQKQLQIKGNPNQQDLQQKQQQLKNQKERFENKVTSLRKYQEYLERVKSTYPDQFPQIQEILNRYNTLKKSNLDLTKQREKTQYDYQEIKKEAAGYQKQLNQTILQLNNDIKELSKKLEEKSNQRNQLQSVVDASNTESSTKNLNLGKILMAIDNLYHKCNQGSQKIRHDYQQFREKRNQGKKQAKKAQQKKTAKQGKQQKVIQNQDFQIKSKIAIDKLKSIAYYMRDFKKIIDQYKEGRAQKKK